MTSRTTLNAECVDAWTCLHCGTFMCAGNATLICPQCKQRRHRLGRGADFPPEHTLLQGRWRNPGDWQCLACKTVNISWAQGCQQCRQTRAGLPQPQHASPRPTPPPNSRDPRNHARAMHVPSTWTCHVCRRVNLDTVVYCTQCGRLAM